MRFLADLIVSLRPVRVLLSTLLFVAIALTTAFSVFAAKSLSTQDTVPMDELITL